MGTKVGPKIMAPPGNWSDPRLSTECDVLYNLYQYVVLYNVYPLPVRCTVVYNVYPLPVRCTDCLELLNMILQLCYKICLLAALYTSSIQFDFQILNLLNN